MLAAPRALLVVFVLVAVVAVTFSLRSHKSHGEGAATGTAPVSSIQATGEILGVAIGSSLDDARRRLDPLREPGSTELRGKGEEARKAYWKLAGTEYKWIMAWTDEEERVVQLSVAPRAENGKPFAEIGDLPKAATDQENVAVWDVQREDRPPYRLIAKGPDRHARSIYMVAGNAELE